MDIKSLILKKLDKDSEVTVADIVKKTGFSRAYVNRVFQQLRDEGKVVLVGQTRQARYIPVNTKMFGSVKKGTQGFHRTIRNIGLVEEHKVLESIINNTGIYYGVKENVAEIIDYAFTEILNNAIEHSGSDKIEVDMKRVAVLIKFEITDFGIGIFKNIKEKLNLSSEEDAIGELLKGKLTTAKEGHSGEGIFFTSKAADNMIIQSSNKKLVFNNVIGDVFIRTVKPVTGTKVVFSINVSSNKSLLDIFNQYTTNEYAFDKTKVIVRLYKGGSEYFSRSQARRIVTGLDKFKAVVLDFNGVDSIGQAFADEIFRVWKSRHPDIELIFINANEDVKFMINRALSGT